MKAGLYAIFDRIADTPLSAPIMAMNDGVAIRGFVESCKDDKISPLEKSLVHLAFIDSEDYSIISTNKYEICNGENAEEVFKNIVSQLKVEEDE